MKTLRISFLASIILFVMAGLQGMAQDAMAGMNMSQPPVVKAVCVLYPTAGNTVSGTVIFTKTEAGVKVVADVSGLTPGKHGFHIHECGDCSAADGTSAGGHFNPGKMNHGAPMDMSRHAGDMGNLEADASGKAHLEYTDAKMQLDGPFSIIGRSMIVHAKEDDLKTQPTGNAGARVACGVIGIGK